MSYEGDSLSVKGIARHMSLCRADLNRHMSSHPHVKPWPLNIKLIAEGLGTLFPHTASTCLLTDAIQQPLA